MKQTYIKPETLEFQITATAYLQVTSPVGIIDDDARPEDGMDTKGDNGWDIW
ncbi:MAG: hypothetical protein IJ064_03120 [Bacteroidaceae bacterium]|nr:hypothetical protein [Bacteroidaceae bacterium]